jgi:serine/threonine-protein kinase
VTGLDLAAAEREIREAGLEPARGKPRHNPGVAAGGVLEVSPPAGMLVKRGRQVLLTPSLGAVDRRVPDISGATLRMARIVLAKAGLQIAEVRHVATDRLPPEQILASFPESGSPAPESGQLAILLSERPAATPFWLPDFSGRDARKSAAILRASGIHVEPGGGALGGLVAAQEPSPGSPVWPGDKVVLHPSGSATPARGRERGW